MKIKPNIDSFLVNFGVCKRSNSLLRSLCITYCHTASQYVILFGELQFTYLFWKIIHNCISLHPKLMPPPFPHLPAAQLHTTSPCSDLWTHCGVWIFNHTGGECERPYRCEWLCDGGEKGGVGQWMSYCLGDYCVILKLCVCRLYFFVFFVLSLLLIFRVLESVLFSINEWIGFIRCIGFTDMCGVYCGLHRTWLKKVFFSHEN